MYIPTKIDDNIGVSLIKKNSKVSLHVAKRIDNKIKLMDCDKDFPFNNPLVTGSAVKMFEFIIETNNFAKRIR